MRLRRLAEYLGLTRPPTTRRERVADMLWLLPLFFVIAFTSDLGIWDRLGMTAVVTLVLALARGVYEARQGNDGADVPDQQA